MKTSAVPGMSGQLCGYGLTFHDVGEFGLSEVLSVDVFVFLHFQMSHQPRLGVRGSPRTKQTTVLQEMCTNSSPLKATEQKENISVCIQPRDKYTPEALQKGLVSHRCLPITPRIPRCAPIRQRFIHDLLRRSRLNSPVESFVMRQWPRWLSVRWRFGSWPTVRALLAEGAHRAARLLVPTRTSEDLFSVRLSKLAIMPANISTHHAVR